jgi:predicted HTH domain antitoxin
MGKYLVTTLSSVRVALALALFKQGSVSLGYAARIADKTLSDMMTMLVKVGVPVVSVTPDDIEHDLKVADAWFQTHPSSSPTQAH